MYNKTKNSIIMLVISMFYIWLAIVILLAIVELSTVNLATIWFVASGIIAMIASLFIDSFAIQFIIFALVGIVLIITTRPLLEKFIKSKSDVRTNLDRIIGMQGIVTEKITKTHTGEVKVDGKKWTAYADRTINVDETVEILKIDGVKLEVKKVEE